MSSVFILVLMRQRAGSRGTADAGARRRAEPGQSGHDRPAGRLVRHHGHRLLGGLGRLFQPQGRAGHDGRHTPREGALHRPGRVPAPSRGRRAAGVRDFPGGGEHLRGVAPGGRDRRHGQRGARHFGRRGRDRHPQIVHPALPGRPAGFGIAQRGDGDGDRLRRIPAAGKHDGHGTGVKEQKTEGRSRKQTRAIPVITQTTGKT